MDEPAKDQTTDINHEANAPVTAQPQEPVPAQAKVLTRSESFKRTFFQLMIGCLITAAGIGVIAILIGSFSDVIGRALGTIAAVAIHALLGFSYLSEADKRDRKDGGRSIELFSNAVFTIIVLSFITSVFGLWQLLPGEIVGKLYLCYIVLLFATLHADILYRIRGFERRIDLTVTANYFLMSIVVAQLLIIIFSDASELLGAFYYRFLAAAGIVDATLTLTAIILHKLYLQKHPELVDEAEKKNPGASNFWRNPIVVLVLIFLALQVVGAIVSLIYRATLHGRY